MPKFAANLSMLFQEVDFLERFEQAAKAGFKYIEYLFPYDYPAASLLAQLKAHKLEQVLFNLPPGNWNQGERGIACLPDRVMEFQEGVGQAIHYAQTLGVKQLNCLAGISPQGIKEDLLWETIISNVQFAADQLATQNMTLLIEPINSKVDMPGFFIDTLDKAIVLITKAQRTNIKVQFDLYHMQIMQGDLLRTLEQHLDVIQHIQFADNPGRHEPGTGEINYPPIFHQLDEMGYQGWVSAEYIPSGNTFDSLSWLRTFN